MFYIILENKGIYEVENGQKLERWTYVFHPYKQKVEHLFNLIQYYQQYCNRFVNN